MKKIKIAQIGFGHDHGPNILDELIAQNDIYEFVGLALPESEKVDFADRYEKYKHLNTLTIEEALDYPGLDAITIETEEINLTKYALAAAKRGLHVHTDKPGGLELAEFEELIATAKENGTVLHFGYMYRYNPAVVDALKKVDSGELGDIYCVEAHMDCYHEPKKRQWLAGFPGGMMFFLGCHLVDFVYRIQGKPEEVIPMNISTGTDGVTADDYAMAVFKFKNGQSFIKTCDIELGGFLRRQLVICGTKGTIEIRPLEKGVGNHQQVAHVGISTDVSWKALPEMSVCEPHGRYTYMMQSFAKMVRGEMKNPYTYDYELELYKLVLEACGVKTK